MNMDCRRGWLMKIDSIESFNKKHTILYTYLTNFRQRLVADTKTRTGGPVWNALQGFCGKKELKELKKIYKRWKYMWCWEYGIEKWSIYMYAYIIISLKSNEYANMRTS